MPVITITPYPYLTFTPSPKSALSVKIDNGTLTLTATGFSNFVNVGGKAYQPLNAKDYTWALLLFKSDYPDVKTPCNWTGFDRPRLSYQYNKQWEVIDYTFCSMSDLPNYKGQILFVFGVRKGGENFVLFLPAPEPLSPLSIQIPFK
jgi:hypothetical protein